MGRTTVSRNIQAPVDRVFDTIAHAENFTKAVPNIIGVTFLSEQRSGVGARFREKRLMNNREAESELEVTEYVENDRVRIVADQGGTVWDTVFTVAAEGGGTRLDMVMDATPYKFLARLMTPLIKGVVRKAIESDMDAVKSYCERSE